MTICRQGVPGSGDSKCKSSEAEKRCTCKRKRKENSVLGAGEMARGVSDEDRRGK